MSGPVLRSDPGIDPAMAAALDRYDVPVASVSFADRIAAATQGRSGERAIARQPRDRRGPWRRRAMVGGLAALLLGTAAAAATLLERVGIHVPAAVAMLSPLGAEAPPPKPPHHNVRPKVAPRPAPPPSVAVAQAPDPTAPPPITVPRPLPLRLALVRARLAALPPAERRIVVRRLVAERLAVRAERRREALADGVPPPPLGEGPWLRAHPAVREALIERVAAIRADSVADHPRRADTTAADVAIPPVASGQTAPPDARQRPVAAMDLRDRAERLRALRDMRAARPGWRRLRRP